ADRAGLAIENARLYDALERRVRERTAELETLNQELESFNHSVAHDLRAPLRSIDGFSKAVLEDCADQLTIEGREHLSRVRAATQKMAELIEDLLQVSRMAGGEVRRERVDLSKLARETVERLREAHPERGVEQVIQDDITGSA